MTNDHKKEIKIFVSHAHSDDEFVIPFMQEFKEMVEPSKRYYFKFWQSSNILPGETWAEEIRHALRQCSLGLLLVSPAFLASKYITENELPSFVGESAKPVIPVMLRKVNLKLHDLKGLEESQIFRLKAGPKNYRSFAQCGSSQRTDFAYELHEHVEDRLGKIIT